MPRLICGFTLLLVISTWSLWLSESEFPQVPWLEVPASFWRGLDRLMLPGLVGALAMGLFMPLSYERTSRTSLAVASLCLVGLLLGNQHRLQPWAYHFLLSAWALVGLPRQVARRCLLGLLVSVYFYSAVNKLDFRFLHTTGALMVRTAAQWWDPSAADQPVAGYAKLAILLPCGELMTALWLAVPRWRHLGRGLASLLHGGLLVILGPWGLGHRWGVLIWNLAFLAQVWALTSTAKNECSEVTDKDVASDPVPPANAFGWPSWRVSPFVLAIFMPAWESWGWWDHWPSWGLYSARAARVEIYLADNFVAQLPPSLQAYCDRTDAEGYWCHLAIDRWSLDSLQSPIYPQARFHWGVLRALMERSDIPADAWMAVEVDPPDRWNGQSERVTHLGSDAIRKASSAYWFNTRPRSYAPLSLAQPPSFACALPLNPGCVCRIGSYKRQPVPGRLGPREK